MKNALEKIQEQLTNPLKKTAVELMAAREKFFNFQLQLVSISAATFSIYLAFGKTTSSGLTKWGFICLAGSLIFGLLSLILRFANDFAVIYFKVFNIEKAFFSEPSNEDCIKFLADTTYSAPIYYDKDIDVDLLPPHKKRGVIALTHFFNAFINYLITTLGFLQLFAILVASILLLIGLLRLPAI